jgi:hypothetical protein
MAPIALKIMIGPTWHIENVNGNDTESLVGYGREFERSKLQVERWHHRQQHKKWINGTRVPEMAAIALKIMIGPTWHIGKVNENYTEAS